MTVQFKAVGTLTDAIRIDNLVVYLLMRTDIPSLNPGKAMAQAFHAGNQIVKWYKQQQVNNPVHEYLGLLGGGIDSTWNPLYFGTTITLGASLRDINRALRLARLQNFICDEVIDPSYPFLSDPEIASYTDYDQIEVTQVFKDGKQLMYRRETTCAWFLGDRSDPSFSELFAGLELHP